MKLDWSNENIKNNLDNILNKDIITSLDLETINFYTNYIFNEKTNLSKKFESIYTDEEILKKTKKIINEELNLSIDDYLCLSNFLSISKDISNKEALKFISNTTTNKDLYDISYIVFESVSQKLPCVLDEIYKSKLIKTELYKKTWIQDSCCNIDDYNKTAYVYVSPFNNDILRIESLYNHEMTHCITAKLNYNLINSVISEFHSIYMNFYTDKFLFNKTNNIEYIKSYYNYFLYLSKTITYFNIIKELSTYDKLNKSIIMDILTKYLNKVDDYNKEMTCLLNDMSSLKVAFVYIYSYFIFLHINYNNDIFMYTLLKQFNNLDTFLKDINFINDNMYLKELYQKEKDKIVRILKQ